MEDVYELVDTYKNDSEKHCCSIKIFSPVIDKKEQKRRIQNIKNTASAYMTEVYRIYTKKKNDTYFPYFFNRKVDE